MNSKLMLKPCIVVLSGVPLTGKTHLAAILESLSNLQVLDVDVIRNEIDESRGIDPRVRMLDLEQEKRIMIRSYSELCRRAEKNALSGIPTLITGTFSRSEFKVALDRITTDGKVPVCAFLLTISDEEAVRRIEKRVSEGSMSNIDSLEKYWWAKGIFGKIEFVPVVEIETSRPECIDIILQNLKCLEA